MIAAGVANPIAHGQAMISTPAAMMNAAASCPSGRCADQRNRASDSWTPPAQSGASPQPRPAASATITTSGTKTLLTRSPSLWILARLLWARSTAAMMCARAVSSPVAVTRINSRPLRLTVPEYSRLPTVLSTGSDSPVSMDSSTAESPSTTSPSVGTVVPGPQDDQVVGAQLGDGDIGISAVGIAPTRPGRRQIKQLAQGAGRPRAGAGLQPMPATDERNDRGSLHEIDVAARMAEQGPRAVSEGGRRAQRHQRVHVRAAGFELAPGAAIEPSAGQNLHGPGEREGTPLKPPRHAESKDPFSQHQRRGAEEADPQVETPTVQHGLARLKAAQLKHARAVARLHDGLDYGRDVLRFARSPTHGGLVRFEAHERAAHAGHA